MTHGGSQRKCSRRLKRKVVLGQDHPETLNTTGNLAAAYRSLGKYEDAMGLETELLEKRKALLGGNHPDTLDVMANLASTYRSLERYEEAQKRRSRSAEEEKGGAG
jgi:tetratricopeptide (TPR) repeat protein